MERRDYWSVYYWRAQDVALNLEDITSLAQNAEIIRGLRDGETTWRGECLQIGEELEHDYDDEEEEHEKNEQDGFIVRDGDDIGWLGYFIGRSKQVQKLCIHHMPKEKINALMERVKHNRSIQFFEYISYYDMQGDDIIDSLSSFIVHNSNLKELRLWYVDIGLDCARSLALALNQRQQKSLTMFSLTKNNLGSEGLAEIIAALSEYKQLESLYVSEDLIGRDKKYYDTLAQIIDLKRITSSKQNAEILRGLRDGETTWRGEYLDIGEKLGHDDDDEEEEEKEHDGFIVRDGDDIGWLGYFIGRNKQVQKFRIHHVPEEKITALMKVVKHNRSIQFFEYISYCDMQGEDIIDSLSSFIVHNSNLKELQLWYVDIGRDGARNLALALNQRQQKSLTRFFLKQNNLGSEGLAEITAALSGYKQLESLYVSEDLIGRDQKYYDTLAQIIDLEYITSSKQNAETLRRLRGDDLALTGGEEGVLSIADYESDFGNHFTVRDRDDWGWLGYFVGRNKKMRKLNLSYLPEEGDNIDAFMEGLNRNQSIEFLDVRHDIEGDDIIDSLSSFIINNSHLTKLDLWNVNIGHDCGRSLELALNQRQQKTLTRLSLNNNHLDDEGLAAIAASLSGYPYLESLGISGNLIGREGCVLLGAIVRSAALHLKKVFFSENDFDDEGFQILAAALANTTTLQSLSLSKNRSITAAGLRALSLLFRSASPVETLYLKDMNIGDDGAEALAAALAGNTSLKHLVISPDSAGITQTGWSAFLRLLCDTSSINNTYQSNHTLVHIGDQYHYERGPNGGKVFCSDGVFSEQDFVRIPYFIAQHLIMNKDHPKDAARLKVFTCHADLNVKALFKYKLKFLPFVVSGHERAREYFFGKYWNGYDREAADSRRLSAVYKFIRGMPLLVADGYHSPCVRCGRKRKFIDTLLTNS